MNSIWIIALNDLRALFRERGTVISLFAVPIVITIALGLVFSTSAGGIAGTIDVIRDDAADPLAQQLVALLRVEAGATYVICDLRDPTPPSDCALKVGDVSANADAAALRALAETRIKNNTGIHPVAIVIPATFSADLIAGKTSNINYLTSAGLTVQTTAQQLVNAALTRLNGALIAARVVTDQAAPGADTRQTLYDSAYQAATNQWAANPVTTTDEVSGQTVAGLQANNGFAQSAPGIGAMFVLQTVLGLATLFLAERQNWTMQRLQTLPLVRWQILAGKLLGRFVIGVLVFAVMLLVGTVFGVQWHDLLALTVIVLVYTLAATSLALAVSTLVRSQRQAAGISLLLALTMAPLGGAWWPLDIVPSWMRVIGHISPIAWSQDAFSAVLYHNGHLIDILPAMGALLFIAAICFAFGLRRFKYE
jgi:ABC-2 type transport system permease protein